MNRRMLAGPLVIVLLATSLMIALALLSGKIMQSSQLAYIAGGTRELRALILADLERDLSVKLAEYPSMSNTPPLWSPDGQWIASWRFALVKPALHILHVETRHSYVIPIEHIFGFSLDLNTALAWSPDSRELLYVQYADDLSAPIMLFDLHSGQSKRLATDIFPQSRLVWPAGSEYAWRYITLQEGGNPILTPIGPRHGSLAWLHPETGDWQERPVRPVCAAFVPFPVVSPDGRQLVCPVLPDDNDTRRADLFLYDFGEPGVFSARRLTQNTGWAEAITWSPDGRHIAFHVRLENNTDIYILDTATGEQRQMVAGLARDRNPAWSPDGQQLAFTADHEGRANIYIYDLKTASIRQLTDHQGNDDLARWSPDGRWITFTSDRESGPRYELLYVMPSTGGEIRRLESAVAISYDAFVDFVTAWRPGG